MALKLVMKIRIKLKIPKYLIDYRKAYDMLPHSWRMIA